MFFEGKFCWIDVRIDKSDNNLEDIIEKEYFLFLVLKEGLIILLLLKMRIEVVSGRWELNLKREKVNKQKCWKNLKIKGKILKLRNCFNWISRVELKMLILRSFLIDLVKT